MSFSVFSRMIRPLQQEPRRAKKRRKKNGRDHQGLQTRPGKEDIRAVFFFFLFLVPVKHQTSDSDSEHRKCLDGVKSQEAKEIEKRKIWGERKR